jgi:hypothetical protein
MTMQNHGSTHTALWNDEHISLCETLDRVLNKGVVVVGEVIISVADVDLLYLDLRALLASVETARNMGALSVPSHDSQTQSKT